MPAESVIPAEFFSPLTGQMLFNPVLWRDGKAYEAGERPKHESVPHRFLAARIKGWKHDNGYDPSMPLPSAPRPVDDDEHSQHNAQPAPPTQAIITELNNRVGKYLQKRLQTAIKGLTESQCILQQPKQTDINAKIQTTSKPEDFYLYALYGAKIPLLSRTIAKNNIRICELAYFTHQKISPRYLNEAINQKSDSQIFILLINLLKIHNKANSITKAQLTNCAQLALQRHDIEFYRTLLTVIPNSEIRSFFTNMLSAILSPSNQAQQNTFQQIIKRFKAYIIIALIATIAIIVVGLIFIGFCQFDHQFKKRPDCPFGESFKIVLYASALPMTLLLLKTIVILSHQCSKKIFDLRSSMHNKNHLSHFLALFSPYAEFIDTNTIRQACNSINQANINKNTKTMLNTRLAQFFQHGKQPNLQSDAPGAPLVIVT